MPIAKALRSSSENSSFIYVRKQGLGLDSIRISHHLMGMQLLLYEGWNGSVFSPSNGFHAYRLRWGSPPPLEHLAFKKGS